jgi:NAD(P)-dependent dehydrogenase (short-subunit alcohol dehydrogenase family)
MALTNSYPSLKNKVVFISGGATNIGAALVEAFLQQESVVVFVDINTEAAQALQQKLHKAHPQAKLHFYPCDLCQVEDLQRIIQQVNVTLGPISVLVNNAANDTRHDFRDLSEDEWNQRINVNLRHPFFAIQAVAPQMAASGGGSVINFGSMSWYECQGGMTGYTTSKAGLEGMTRGLARDLAEDNIRINTVVPGWVMTERQLTHWVDADTEKDIQKSQCMKARLVPEDVAAMVLFLASDDSKMCTAQNFIVDGGWI